MCWSIGINIFQVVENNPVGQDVSKTSQRCFLRFLRTISSCVLSSTFFGLNNTISNSPLYFLKYWEKKKNFHVKILSLVFLLITNYKPMASLLKTRSNFPEVFSKLAVLLIMPQTIELSTVEVCIFCKAAEAALRKMYTFTGKLWSKCSK